jgi:hypothetical protein
MKKFYLILTIITAFIVSCGPRIYVAPTFTQEMRNHKTVAVLPFDVVINSKKLPKGMTAEGIKEMNKSNGYAMQNEVYTFFLRQMSRGRYTVEFQDIHKSNAIIQRAGYTYEELKTMSKDDLAHLLDVDAIVSGRIMQERPMSDGAAVAVGLLVGFWGTTNRVSATLTIHDKFDGKLMWKYDYEASGSVGSSTQQLGKALMRNVSKKFPYRA